MRVITVNVCGIRSAAAKGLFRWLRRQQADFICLQETKRPGAPARRARRAAARLPQLLLRRRAPGLRRGGALHAPRAGAGACAASASTEFDREGRYLEAQVGDLSVVSLYLPSGSAGPQRQASKFRFLEAFTAHLARLRRRRRHYILSGDWNIAHRPIDLRNWKSQPEELRLPARGARLDGRAVRARPATWTPSARCAREPDLYTWWSNRGQARANNVGWRIDYQVVSRTLAGKARARLHIQGRALLGPRPARSWTTIFERAAGAAGARCATCSRARRCSRSSRSARRRASPTRSPRARCRRG